MNTSIGPFELKVFCLECVPGLEWLQCMSCIRELNLQTCVHTYIPALMRSAHANEGTFTIKGTLVAHKHLSDCYYYAFRSMKSIRQSSDVYAKSVTSSGSTKAI